MRPGSRMIRLTPTGRVLDGAPRALALLELQGEIPLHEVEWIDDRGGSSPPPPYPDQILNQVAARLQGVPA